MKRSSDTSFYHGSRRYFVDGFVLSPQADGYVHQDDVREFEVLAEARRPQGCLSRLASVFLSADPDLIDGAGGYIDAVYLVEPLSVPQASDLAWYSEAWCEYSSEPRDDLRVGELIDGYWSGLPYPDREVSNFEYRVSGAAVLEMFELNVEMESLEVVSEVECGVVGSPSPF